MSKERLEEIRERVLVDKVYYKYLDGTKGYWGKTYTLSEEDYKYLYEQAERVQELEQELHFCQVTKLSMDSVEKYTEDLKKQNKRYREALESIKELGKWGMFTDKYARIAQKALEEGIDG